MKEYLSQQGGRYLFNEDIKNLQDLALAAASAFTDQSIQFVVSGCKVSVSEAEQDGVVSYTVNVSEGMIVLNNKIRKVAAYSQTFDTIYNIGIYKTTQMGQDVLYVNGERAPQYIEYGAEVRVNYTRTNDDAYLMAELDEDEGTWSFPDLSSFLGHYCVPVDELPNHFFENGINGAFINLKQKYSTAAGRQPGWHIVSVLRGIKGLIDNELEHWRTECDLDEVSDFGAVLFNNVALYFAESLNSFFMQNLFVEDFHCKNATVETFSADSTSIKNMLSGQTDRIIASGLLSNSLSSQRAAEQIRIKIIVTDYNIYIRGYAGFGTVDQNDGIGADGRLHTTWSVPSEMFSLLRLTDSGNENDKIFLAAPCTTHNFIETMSDLLPQADMVINADGTIDLCNIRLVGTSNEDDQKIMKSGFIAPRSNTDAFYISATFARIPDDMSITNQ